MLHIIFLFACVRSGKSRVITCTGINTFTRIDAKIVGYNVTVTYVC